MEHCEETQIVPTRTLDSIKFDLWLHCIVSGTVEF